VLQSPTKGVQQFGLKGKLEPRYIGPFEILEGCGPVAYRIRLPSRLAVVHDVFHISQLKKCVKFPEEIIEQQDLEVEPDLSYVEYPMKILDSKERSTRREKVRIYKIQWKHHTKEEATWETEHNLQQNFSDFLSTNPGIQHPSPFLIWNLGTRFFLGGKVVTLRVSSC